VCLLPNEAPFVLGDVTEIPGPQAYKTPCVGTPKDGGTKGFWVFTLAAPYRGRSIPCGLVTFSSTTIRQKDGSRNLAHQQTFHALKVLLGARPLVLDREFSYFGLPQFFMAANTYFVIRVLC